MEYIPRDTGLLPSDEVKAIKIRGELHQIKHNAMSGYKTICGKMASFGHSVYRVSRGDLDCLNCQQK